MNITPTLHLIYGIPGSGKTSFAVKLERETRGVRFSPDEWMVTLHGTNPLEKLFREQHERIMLLVWEHVGRVLRAGCDVVLDAGLWTRADRDEARKRAAEFDAQSRLYALQCDVDEARRRVAARNKALPFGALEITEATFEVLLKRIEPLGEDEAHILVEGRSVGIKI
ncbi:MAG: ATP-binding protein [Nibricoccus sp.]